MNIFRFGDIAHSVFHPIAVGSDALFGTNLQNCQGCIGAGGRRDQWNQFGSTIADWLWDRREGENEMNEWVVTKQYIVRGEGMTMEDAIVASKTAACVSANAQMRQMPAQSPSIPPASTKKAG